MKRVMLVVAYDGTNYHGWQIQQNGNSIEAELNKALTDLCEVPICVSGASRTDTGVHALMNLAVFDTDMRMPGEKFSYALNTRLPWDIRVVKSVEVESDFHPRYAGTIKTYEYRIYNADFPNPLRRLYTFFDYGQFNVEAMNEAAKYLIGEHDFKSFCSVNTDVETTVREIVDAKVFRDGSEIVISVSGKGFLYNMVRIIAGTLIEIGKGKRQVSEVPNILADTNRYSAGPTAPPMGLTLVKYEFLDEKYKELVAL